MRYGRIEVSVVVKVRSCWPSGPSRLTVPAAGRKIEAGNRQPGGKIAGWGRTR